MFDFTFCWHEFSQDHHEQGTLEQRQKPLGTICDDECPHRCSAHLSCTGGSSHRQHFPLLQIQADIFQDRCDIQVGKEEAGVVHVSVCFVLLLDLLKQLTYSLQQNLQDKRSPFCLDRNKLIR